MTSVAQNSPFALSCLYEGQSKAEVGPVQAVKAYSGSRSIDYPFLTWAL